MEVWRWLSLQTDNSKSRSEAEVILSVMSLISSSAGYTFGPDNFQILDCLWTLHHRCTCKWDWTEMLAISFPLRAKTAWIPLRMNTERCRREERHNTYLLECQLSARRLFRQKPRKYCQLETQVSWWCHLQSTCVRVRVLVYKICVFVL